MSVAHPLDPARPRADVLARFADLFDDDLLERSGAIAIGISSDDDHVDLHTQPLPGHPVPSLLGYVAPPDWWAFGVAATGMTRPLPRAMGGSEPWDVDAPADDRIDKPLRIVHLVSRDGEVHARWTIEGHEPHITTDDGPEGLIPDVCRRVLQLPTPPPPSIHELNARSWLRTVVELFADAPVDPNWFDVARCYPTVSSADHPPDPTLYAADHLVRCGELSALAWPWSRLRTAMASLPTGAMGLSPAELDWMDDGMFARWWLHDYVELIDLLDIVEALARRDVHQRVVEVLDGWGVLPAPRHDPPVP